MKWGERLQTWSLPYYLRGRDLKQDGELHTYISVMEIFCVPMDFGNDCSYPAKAGKLRNCSCKGMKASH